MSDDLCANVVYINYKQHKYKEILLSNMSLIQKRFLFIKNVNFKSCINCINFIEIGFFECSNNDKCKIPIKWHKQNTFFFEIDVSLTQ
jgi:hypothetical protein